MIINQIKSVLRNKGNIIYIAVLIMVFIALNVSISLQAIIDAFYDEQMNNLINEQIEMPEGWKIENIEIEKTIYIPDHYFVLTEEIEENIRGIKHVKDVRNIMVNYGDYEKLTCNIIVDDWKNVSYVQNELDKQGIETWKMDGNEYLYKSHSEISVITKVVTYVIFVMVMSISILCYRNIIKNEKENIRLLKVMGYNNGKIKIILYSELLVLTLIALIIATIILDIGLFYIVNSSNLKISLNGAKNVIINIVVIAISLFTSIVSYLKVSNKD